LALLVGRPKCIDGLNAAHGPQFTHQSHKPTKISRNIQTTTSPANKWTSAAHSPEAEKVASANVLTAMLYTSDQVRHELVDGTFVNNRPRHTLRHFDLVLLAAYIISDISVGDVQFQFLLF